MSDAPAPPALPADLPYREIFEQHPCPVWVYDLDTLDFLTVNAATEHVYGYTRDELRRMTLLDIRPPETHDALRRRVARIRSLPTSGGLFTHLTKDGRRIDAEIHSRAITFDGRPARLVVALDVTEREEALARLRTSEERFRLLSIVTRDVIWDLDVASGRVECNENYQRVFGYAPSKVPHDVTTLFARVHPSDRERVTAGLHRVLEGSADSWTEEYQYAHADGRFANIVDHAYVVRDADGRAERVVGSMTDVTERTRLEHQLAHSQKLDAVGRLAGGIAHDFNNMLTAIVGFAQFVLSELPDDSPLRDDVQQIVHASDRASALTRQLLAFSRKQLLQPRVVDITGILLELTKLLRRMIGEDIELDLRLAPDLARVKVDAAQLEQAIINLVVNARDAMPHGGLLVLATSNVTIGPEHAKQHPDVPPGHYVALEVRDTGTGMPPATLERIFEPFFTTKDRSRGTGLGLPTVYGVVKQSGGHITVQSRLGAGTAFTIFLPVTSERPVERAPATDEPPALEGRETILVAEDEPLVRRLTTSLLRGYGYQVLEARDGDAALAASDAHRGPIDLLVTDVIMPRMNGRELATLLRARRPAIRVLFVSGYTESAIGRNLALEDGTALLEKPFTPEQLAKHVRRVLDAAR